MAVETSERPIRIGWCIKVRRAYGLPDGMKAQRLCDYRYELDIETLVWTRGRNFPISRVESRLMCPRCGSRRVVLLFDIPPTQKRVALRF
jgi:DNA-directed RNA polymerase subunit RPC12/RpoP